MYSFVTICVCYFLSLCFALPELILFHCYFVCFLNVWVVDVIVRNIPHWIPFVFTNAANVSMTLFGHQDVFFLTESDDAKLDEAWRHLKQYQHFWLF